MICEIRLKTGFYETKPYNLFLDKNKLVLSSVETGKEADIKIYEDEIFTITFTRKKLSEIEIQTRDKVYQGVFSQNADFEELIRCSKENLRNKIICKYEGGN